MGIVVSRHCVDQDSLSGLSPMQNAIIASEQKIRIVSAPTGTGKSYAFQKAMLNGERILFIVPTRRLAQNLANSTAESLAQENGWTLEKAMKKIAIWNSDEAAILREKGETNVRAKRVRQIVSLNEGIEGGEIVFAVPESLSNLILRSGLDKGQSDIGVFEILNDFEHIVFDEFHTISARGFGIAAVFAKLAAGHTCRAKVSFLSATPLDIRSVLKKIGISEENISEIEEMISDKGRPVHGDVRLSMYNCPDITTLVENHIDEIKSQINKKRQVVIIYNALIDLQRDLPDLEKLFSKAGIESGRVLLINSIDDSRTGSYDEGFFVSGRHNDPEKFDILVATASVEMGVTFRSDFMIMEPGFDPMSFLQRYGRAARGDHDGHVLVRYSDDMTRKSSWLSELVKWIEKTHGMIINITELTEFLSRKSRDRFKNCSDDSNRYFGMLSNRAAYTSGLYWNIMMQHSSNQGHRWRILKEQQPDQAKAVYRLLEIVKEMGNGVFAASVNDWCIKFESEAKKLRDMDETIRIVQNDNGKKTTFNISCQWFQRHTDLIKFPMLIGEDGKDEIHLEGKMKDHFLDQSRYIKPLKNVRFPHTSYSCALPDDSFLVESWVREFRNKTESMSSIAWEEYPKAMESALKLVSLTGLVVTDDMEVDTCSGIL